MATKKSFKTFLNAQPHLNDRLETKGSLTGQRTNLYGDYLYRADPAYFNHLYAYWLIHGDIGSE